MSNYVTGFMEAAKKYGISEKQAMFSLKAAAAADPAIAAQAGMGGPPQGAAPQPPPQDLGGGQPPLPGDGGQGIPPELEQLINSLPPEVLQQLLAEVQQELQGGGGGGDGGQGGPPQGGPQGGGMGGPPQHGHHKQGSAAEDLILAKTAGYQEGFLEAAKSYNATQQFTVSLYKQALAEMEANPIDLSLIPDTEEKIASHAEGVITAAMERGFSKKEAVDLYRATFND